MALVYVSLIKIFDEIESRVFVSIFPGLPIGFYDFDVMT